MTASVCPPPVPPSRLLAPWTAAGLLVLTVLTVVLPLEAASTIGDDAAVPINQLAADGQIREWAVIGPFPPGGDEASADGYHIDYLAAQGGEATAAWGIGDRLPGPDGRARRVVALSAWSGGYCEDRSYDGYVGYATCRLQCASAGRYILYLASNGSPRLWLDGKEILGGRQPRHPHRRWQYGCRVELGAGLHELRVKVANQRGYWGFQVECFDEESHERVWPGVVRRLELTGLQHRDGQFVGTVEPWPRPIGISLPIEVRCGREDLMVAGRTGEPFTIAAPAGSGQTVELQIVSPTVGRPLVQRCFLGDLDAAWQAVGRRIEALAPSTGPWAPLLQDFCAWVRYRVDQPHDRLVTEDIDDLRLIERLVSHWEAGGDLIADHPWISFPARRRVGDIDWLYRFRLRGGQAEGPLPVVINLHGAGGTDRPIGIAGDPAVPPAEPDDLPAHLRLAPRAQSGIWWDSAALGGWLDDLQAVLPIDAERVSLTGFSMGGMGTWSWATDQPDRFAALGPKAGYGDPTRLAVLREVPVWAVHGNRDHAVPVHLAERCVTALQAAGGQVRYTLLSDRGHGFGDSFDGQQLDRWLLAQWRQPADATPTGSGTATDGLAIARQPARRVLAIPLISDPWSLPRDLVAAETALATVWRRSGHLYDAAAELLVDDPALLQSDRWSLTVQVPEGPRVDTWATTVERHERPAVTCASLPVAIAGTEDLAPAIRRFLRQVREVGHQPDGPVSLRLEHRRRYGQRQWTGTLSVPID